MKKIIVLFVCFLGVFVLLNLPKKPIANEPIPKSSPNTPPQPTPPKPQSSKPGDQTVWFEFLPLKKLSDPSWGAFLTDIENHLPEKMGTTYRDTNKITWSHETTHGIQSHLNNTYRPQGDTARSYGFYVGNNKAVMIPQPKIRISNVAEMVPQSMRKGRYQLYLVSQAGAWNADPLYLFDEWNAYVNGAATGLEVGENGKTDFMFACIEFNVYAIYTCMATKSLDTTYDSKQLFEFAAWNSKRCMEIYQTGYKKEIFNWDNHKYLNELQTGNDAKAMRQFVIATWGAAWAEEVFGFKE